jgi:hypothetical protein
MEETSTLQKAEIKTLFLAAVGQMLVAHGFTDVAMNSQNRMDLVDARTATGTPVRFWLKKDWTGGNPSSGAVALGGTTSAQLGDSVFAEKVDARVAAAKSRGAHYLLLVHVVASRITQVVALHLDHVGEAYRLQLEGWPRRARNGAMAQLWFHEAGDDAECVNAVRAFALPLSAIANPSSQEPEASLDAKTVWAEVQRRLKQEAFRARVGERYGWRCAVSGTDVREVLDAAHLPGRDWRRHNLAEDGVMLRVDLHRLLDRGLAELRDGAFWISGSVGCEHYAAFHGRRLTVS